MLVSQAHSFTQQARLAITLAWVAGYTNVCTLLACGTVTSHVSGTVSNLGHYTVEGKWALVWFMLYLLGTFFTGAAVSALMIETGRRRGWESIYVMPMAAQALLLTFFAIGMEFHDPQARVEGTALWWMTGVASMAMGLQNATITRISGGVVRTTHLTGVLTDLGSESAQFAWWVRDRVRDGAAGDLPGFARSLRSHPAAQRLALLFSIIASFALGAGLGAIFYESHPRLTMIPPVLFLIWIIYQDARAPICEIEESPLHQDRQYGLPSQIAVYHLRKDKVRRGRFHRLPDLLRWFERLPGDRKVIVLDLADLPQIDENAALELRALSRRLESQHRHLVIAGLTMAQFASLRERAGDTLDASNVCPDLDLAIARAVAMLG
ncbi:MAG TPA: DUF1275 family protein [Phycisphaerales bacterium]|nr:DUF1275 family protein [Phycisphaerales bacterium]